MKRLSLFASLALALSFASEGIAAPIVGVTVESVSSDYNTPPWDLQAVHTVDGSGLVGTGHDVVAQGVGNSWQTISQTGTANIVFDLGGLYALDRVHVWNLNFYDPYNGRGAKDVRILTSDDLTAWELPGHQRVQHGIGSRWRSRLRHRRLGLGERALRPVRHPEQLRGVRQRRSRRPVRGPLLHG